MQKRKAPKLESFGVFGAAIQIRTGDLILVVKETKLKHYHAHRILMPDGQVFAIPEMENAEPSTAVGQPLKEDGFNTPISSASNDRVAEKQNSVNPSETKNIKRDVKAMMAV